MRSFLQACTAVAMTAGLLFTGAVSSQAADTPDPGDVDTAPAAPIVLPVDEAAAAGVTLIATFSCMVAQGEVATGSTAAQTLGRVTEDGVSVAPTGTPISPSEGCINGAVALVADSIDKTTDARYAFSLRTLERNIVTGRTAVPPVGASSGTVGIARVRNYDPCPTDANPTPADRRNYLNQRGLVNSIDGFMNARAKCDPKWMNWTTDECSVGDPLNNGIYNFRSACLRHDYNWRNLKDASAFYTSAKNLRNKARADSKFAADMGVQCRLVSGTNTKKLKACYALAAAYTTAVRIAERNTTDMYPSGTYEW